MEKRQRKYRAWHVERKEMLYSDFSIIATSPSWSGAQNFGMNDSELKSLLRKLDNERGDLLGGDYTLIDWACFSDLIVMDWTGLTDNIGVDIYESDIIKHPDATEPENVGWLIKWKRFGFIAELAKPFIDERTGQQLCTELKDYFTKCEVIGNIYKNPELIAP